MIYQKINTIMNEIIPLGRIRRDEIVPTLLPLLAKYNLVVKPREVSEFKSFNQEASFIAEYELVDAQEGAELESVLVKVPARWI